MRISFEWRTTVVESQDLTDYEQVRDSPLHSENVCHTFFVLCAARFSICLRAKSVPLFMYILIWCLHKSVRVGLYVKELKFRCLTTCTVCETSEPNPSHLLHKGMPS